MLFRMTPCVPNSALIGAQSPISPFRRRSWVNGYRVGVLIALHRNDRADAYMLGLLRTPGVEFDLLQKNFYALTFS